MTMKKKAKVFKKPRNLKMSKRSEKALDESIKHWEIDIKGNDDDVTAHGCSLCQIYLSGNKNCRGCPVYLKAKKAGCDNTPYIRYDECKVLSKSQRKRLAQNEIDFLQSCYY